MKSDDIHRAEESVIGQWRYSLNRGLFQRLSGFETGHPAAAGPLPAFDFSVSDEQDAAFLVSVMDCSDCDSSGLGSPNSGWSIARLKEYLRRKKRPSKREKAELLEPDHLHRHIVTSNPSLFVCLLFFFFFSLFLFLFFSSPACCAQYFSSTGTQPDKYCFTFSASLFERTLRVGLHRVLAARLANPLRTLLRLRCDLSCSASFR